MLDIICHMMNNNRESHPGSPAGEMGAAEPAADEAARVWITKVAFLTQSNHGLHQANRRQRRSQQQQNAAAGAVMISLCSPNPRCLH